MSVDVGTRLGSLEITALLGKGGMGEVYRARDLKLKRDVAIKVLPDEFSRDTDRVSRFQREAEVLASLNHPNIAVIYDLREANQTRYLVLELVEGETLADRIARGPIPVEEALDIAKRICEALEAAHERGVVHRDLKPANVKITPEGKVKVLDFGLARISQPLPPTEDFSHSPTLGVSATGTGVILGTSAYISPEHARGEAADSRSAIWAFGVVLYEMLTGKPAFEGETVIEILSNVLKVDPDWTALPVSTPPAMASMLRRCLQKDRNRRLRDIADARFQIEEALSTPVAPAAVITAVPKRRQWQPGRLTVAAAALAAAFATGLYFRTPPADVPETRLQIVTPPGNPTFFALSPDGRNAVFEAVTAGKSQLWLRPLQSDSAKPLAGTEDAAFPFWSPDGRSVGFFANGKLERIDIAGGAAQMIADAPNGIGGSWNGEGVILFTPSGTAPLFRVPARGGAPLEVTRLQAPQQVSHRFPHFLPDGRHFLFFTAGTAEGQGVYVGSLDSKETRRVLDADSAAAFVQPDQIVFMRQRTLFAQRLDLRKLAPVGDSFVVAERVILSSNYAADGAFSASAFQTLAYRSSGTEKQFIWVDRFGKQITGIGEPDAGQPASMRLSPDDRTIAVARLVDSNFDVWLIETLRGVRRRFTSDPAIDLSPIWSPDGNRIVFSSRRRGPHNLYQKSVAGAGSEELLLETSESKWASDWSPDGRLILYNSEFPKTRLDIWALPLEGNRKPFPVVQTAFDEAGARFSPDGRWIAYQSNESGKSEIYVQRFSDPPTKWQISTNGGYAPHWGRNGQEIFFVGPDNRVMAAPVALHTNATVEPGTPTALFSLRPGSEYDVSHDNQRFLVNPLTEDAAAPPITVILNWHPG